MRTGLSILTLSLGFMAATLVPASAETINATMVAGHPPVFPWVKHASQAFIPTVNKELEGSDYTIKWSEQYSGSLAKVGGVLEALEGGLAELGVVPTLFEAAKLAEQNVTYMTPFVSNDPGTLSKLFDDMHKSHKEMRKSWENNGVVYLGGSIVVEEYMLFTNFPVNAIDDLKGKKIGAPGPAVNWVKGTGAVGVAGNLTTYYNDIKTGVYDGVIVFPTAALPAKLHEVAPYITRVGFGAQYAGGVVANKQWFDAQPAVVQEALRKAGDAQREAYLADIEEASAKALEVMKANGATVKDVDDAFKKTWADGLDNIAKAWAAKLDGEGRPGTFVLKTYMNNVREVGAKPVRDWDLE